MAVSTETCGAAAAGVSCSRTLQGVDRTGNEQVWIVSRGGSCSGGVAGAAQCRDRSGPLSAADVNVKQAACGSRGEHAGVCAALYPLQSI